MTESRIVFVWGQGIGKGLTINRHRNLLGVIESLYILHNYKFTRNHYIGFLKMGEFYGT